MIHRKFSINGRYVLSAAVITAILLCAAFAAAAAELTVVYTGNSNGKLIFCNCPNDPYGGLSERVTLIGDLRKSEGPFLLVDAGSMVGLFGDYDLKASCVFRMMNMMKYDVAAVGRNEVFEGANRIASAAREAKFPLVSVSFDNPALKKPFFKPYTIHTVSGVKAAVTSVSDSTTFFTVKSREADFSLRPADTALRGVIGEMASSADFVIVLSQMAPERNEALLTTFPEIDLIVEAYGNSVYDPPHVMPDGVIVATGSYGENTGLVTLSKTDGRVRVVRSRIIPVKDIPEDPKAHDIVVEYYRKRK